MKIFFLLLCLTLCGIGQGYAQSKDAKTMYRKFMADGDAAFKAQDYPKAIKGYNAAMIICKDSIQTVQKKIDLVFIEINLLKQKADKAKAKAEKEKQRAEKSEKQARIEKIRADSALKVANTIVNAMYFYEGKFALAYKKINWGNGKYGFIMVF